MAERTNTVRTLSRRSALKLIGAGGGLVLGAATGAARKPPKPNTHEYHPGETADFDGGTVETYATTNPAGQVSSLGVHVDGDAFAAFAEGEASEDEFVDHLHFPTETEGGDGIDVHQFTFAGFHYNPEGHPPPEVYTVPHFDFHFYMLDHEAVAEIPFGVGAYEIPEDQFPDGYVTEDELIGLRVVEGSMGEHLLDGTSPEVEREDAALFEHTYIYGVYDPTIDPDSPDGVIEDVPLGPGGEEIDVNVYGEGGEGRLTFVEPMVTVDYLDELDGEEVVAVETPDRFYEPDDYPTEYVMKPDGDGGVYVSIDGFEEFPGRDG